MKSNRLIEMLTIVAIVGVGAVGQWWLARLLISALSGA